MQSLKDVHELHDTLMHIYFVKIKLFQNMAMLHTTLKGITNAATSEHGHHVAGYRMQQHKYRVDPDQAALMELPDLRLLYLQKCLKASL